MSTTASSPNFLTAYVEGFAQAIAAAQVGFSWRTLGDGAPIFLATVPTGPDKILTLTPTPMDAHPTLTDAGVNLQIRFRAGEDIRELWAARDAVRGLLQGRFPTRLPTGVYVSSLAFIGGVSLGMDDSRRWMWADNYRTRATERPAA